MPPVLQNPITLSAPTMGDIGAATYKFATRGYTPPHQGRDIGSDYIHNQNGKFTYVYDSGPGPVSWRPFAIVCDDHFKGLGSATQQYSNLVDLWNRIGSMQMQAPDGLYQVRWGENDFEKQFIKFPQSAGDKLEFFINIQLEEG